MLANKLVKCLDRTQWHISIVDHDVTHYYQPGFLFIPFGIYTRDDVVKPRRAFIPRGVEFVAASIERIDAAAQTVELDGGAQIAYDILVVATGSVLAPEQIEGMTGSGWRRNIFDFYTFEGALALHNFLAGGAAANLPCISPKCPSSALLLPWSSRFSPIGSSRCAGFAATWRSNTSRRFPAHSQNRPAPWRSAIYCRKSTSP